MGNLKFVAEPEQHVSLALSALVEQVREILRADPTDTLWDCWARETPHGFVLRLQQARRTVPYSGRAATAHVTYSGGGTANFLLDDVSAWVQTQAQAAPAPLAPRARRRSDPSRGRTSRSRGR